MRSEGGVGEKKDAHGNPGMNPLFLNQDIGFLLFPTPYTPFL